MTERLLAGFERFKKIAYHGAEASMPALVEQGQNPDTFIISCIDSRANPGAIFQAGPGAFFAHKAMGAIVRPYKQGTALAAALQFALNYHQVKTIIVLGHTGCGAIQALAEQLDDNEITSFINVAKAALQKGQSCCKDHDELLAFTEKETVLQGVENLKGYPCVATALKEGRVEIKPWMFDMKNGEILEYDPQAQDFKAITTTHHETEDSRQQHA